MHVFSKSYIGVDIGVDSVKFVELRRKRKQIILNNVGIIRLKEIPFHDGLSKEDLAAEAIKWILAKYNIQNTVCAVTLPATLIYSKNFTLPAVSEEKIHQIIQFEARGQIPFPLDDVCWDYSVLGQAFSKDEVNVIIHAVKKNIAYSFLDNLTSAGLDIAVIDVNSMALYNALVATENVSETILVDMGAKSTNVVLSEGDSCWTRNLPIGGNDFTQKIADEMNISFDEAEELKKQVGLQGEGADLKISDVLQDQVRNLAKEIQRTIGYYRGKRQGLIINKVILSGGTARLKGLLSFFMESLKIDVEVLDPFSRILINPNLDMEEIQHIRNNFGIAFGLALRQISGGKVNINLMPEDVKHERYVKANKIFLWISAFVAVMFFVLFNYNTILDIKDYSGKLAKSQKIFDKYKLLRKNVSKIQKEIKPLSYEIKLLQTLYSKQTEPLEMFLFMKNIIPNDVWFTQLNYGIMQNELKLIEQKKIPKRRYVINDKQKKQDDKLEIKGRMVHSYKKLNALAIAFSSNPLFKDVKVMNAQEIVADKEKQIEFTLEIEK